MVYSHELQLNYIADSAIDYILVFLSGLAFSGSLEKYNAFSPWIIAAGAFPHALLTSSVRIAKPMKSSTSYLVTMPKTHDFAIYI